MTTLAAVIGRDVLANRPAAGVAGRLYEATDTTPPTVYRDNGASWDTYATAGAATVTTTRGDLIARGASADQRLAVGAAGKILTSDGTDPAWGNGPLTTKGDLIGAGASGAIGRLPVGSDGQVLTADAASSLGVKWGAASGGGGGSFSQAYLGYNMVGASNEAYGALGVAFLKKITLASAGLLTDVEAYLHQTSNGCFRSRPC
jgi:hypothetical protein